MTNDIAISASNLSKCYQICDAPRNQLKQFVAPRLQRLTGQTPKQYFREFWALRDISFGTIKGETVGIIRRNGSGKSTLLQMICGTLFAYQREHSNQWPLPALLDAAGLEFYTIAQFRLN